MNPPIGVHLPAEFHLQILLERVQKLGIENLWGMTNQLINSKRVGGADALADVLRVNKSLKTLK